MDIRVVDLPHPRNRDTTVVRFLVNEEDQFSPGLTTGKVSVAVFDDFAVIAFGMPYQAHENILTKACEQLGLPKVTGYRNEPWRAAKQVGGGQFGISYPEEELEIAGTSVDLGPIPNGYEDFALSELRSLIERYR